MNTTAWVRSLVAGRSFADVGGLWGTENEMISQAVQAGAARAAMVDAMPEGNEWWTKFHARCADLGVTAYDAMVADITDPMTLNRLGTFDIVHCSGVIYHVPDPFAMLRNLYLMTESHLILTSVVLVPPVRGLVSYDTAYFVPLLTNQQRAVLARHFDGLGLKAAGVNAPLGGDWMDPTGVFSYSPWWWLWTPGFLRRMLEVCRFQVEDEGFVWERRSYSFLCSKEPKRQEQ